MMKHYSTTTSKRKRKRVHIGDLVSYCKVAFPCLVSFIIGGQFSNFYNKNKTNHEESIFSNNDKHNLLINTSINNKSNNINDYELAYS